MVITGLTRNQFAGNRTWVRIPPSPPKQRHLFFAGAFIFVLASEGFEVYARRGKSHRLRQRITVILIQQNDGYFML